MSTAALVSVFTPNRTTTPLRSAGATTSCTTGASGVNGDLVGLVRPEIRNHNFALLQRDDIAGLMLLSPSSVLNSGWGVGFQRRLSAWTLHGLPLPFMPSVE